MIRFSKVLAPSPSRTPLRYAKKKKASPQVPAWLEPVLGPSGARHPAAWAAPAAALVFLAPPWLSFAGEAILAGVFWNLLARPVGRFTRATMGVSALILVAFLLLSAVAHALGAGSPSVSALPGYRNGELIDPGPGPVIPGVAARVAGASTFHDVDAPPELLNRAAAGRLFHGGRPETRGAAVGVTVRAEGTVAPYSVETRGDAHREFAEAALPGPSSMRSRPFTTDGVAVPAVAWIEVEFDR